jgi:hypothetical protein
MITGLIRVHLGSSAVALLLTLTGIAHAADDAGTRALQQNQMQRQHQQDQLQLRMQQHQSSMQNPPADNRQRQAAEQLELDQALRQQQLQTHQQRALHMRPDTLTDDAGTSNAKAQIELQRARQESRRQLEQFDRELQSAARQRRQEPPPRLPGVPDPGPGALRLP